MHMADALISPTVGGILWVATAGTIAHCSRKVSMEHDDRKVALMGILGAFIFAAQMINFTIPGTGSSGHLGGGLILAILLGSHAAFLVMASVLTVQALFFADGGLLALGCNIFNLGFFPCFVAYPFVYRKITRNNHGQKRILVGAILSAVIGLQLGAFAVVVETVASGIAELPFITFAYLMQPIHLAIGIVEGCVTAGVVLFIFKARPEILYQGTTEQSPGGMTWRRLMAVLIAVTIVTGGTLSWLASTHPDGLEWSIASITGSEEVKKRENRIHNGFERIQEELSFLPSYNFKDTNGLTEKTKKWAELDAGASLSGLTGGALTLILAGFIGLLLKRRRSVT